MSYKIKTLVEDKYPFNDVYWDKQKSVSETTGLNFTLEEIALFLKKQTNNFTISNTIAEDLDEAIFNLVERFESEKKGGDEKELPKDEGKSPYSEAEIKEWEKAIFDMEKLIKKGIYDEAEVAEWTKAIKDLQKLLNQRI